MRAANWSLSLPPTDVGDLAAGIPQAAAPPDSGAATGGATTLLSNTTTGIAADSVAGGAVAGDIAGIIIACGGVVVKLDGGEIVTGNARIGTVACESGVCGARWPLIDQKVRPPSSSAMLPPAINPPEFLRASRRATIGKPFWLALTSALSSSATRGSKSSNG